MITIKDLIDSLQCVGNNQKPCGNCVFNPKQDIEWPYGCVKGERDMAVKIAEVLKKICEGGNV